MGARLCSAGWGHRLHGKEQKSEEPPPRHPCPWLHMTSYLRFLLILLSWLDGFCPWTHMCLSLKYVFTELLYHNTGESSYTESTENENWNCLHEALMETVVRAEAGNRLLARRRSICAWSCSASVSSAKAGRMCSPSSPGPLQEWWDWKSRVLKGSPTAQIPPWWSIINSTILYSRFQFHLLADLKNATH